jgi:hypothetical protein
MRFAAWLAVIGWAILAAASPAMAAPRCGTVEVVDRDGRPVAGAEVAYHGSDPREQIQDGPGPESFTTNAAGRACAEAFLDSGFLEVHAPKRLGGWCVANEVVRYRGWRASAPVTRVTLRIKRIHRSRWHGRVVAGDGKPIAGASILIIRIYPKDTQCSEFGPDDWRAVGSDGRFALPALPDGAVELRVDADGYAQKVFFIHLPGERRDLAIERGGHWTGRVLDPDGAPIERCLITLRSSDEIEVSSACGSDGAIGFDLRHLPLGELKVRIRVTTHPALPNRTFVDRTVVVPDEQRREDIRLPAGLTLAGQVVTASGAPAARATVTAVSTDRDRCVWEGALEVQADDSGRFVFHHVAAGEWYVAADLVTAKPEDRRKVSAGATDVTLVSRARR